MSFLFFSIFYFLIMLACDMIHKNFMQLNFWIINKTTRYYPIMGYPEKKTRHWGHTFFGKTLGIFRFLTLPLEIPGKTKLHPWKLCKILHPLRILGSETKTPRTSTFFSWSLVEILYCFHTLNPTCLFFLE